MGFAGSDAFASLSFPFSLRRGPPPKFGGANDKLDRLFYDSIARRRHHIVSASSFGNIDLAAECWILKGDTFVGRADVIDTATGEVWEIKTKRQESTAAKQAEKYKDGTAVRTNTVIKKLGHAGAFSGAFHINMGDYSYDVSYWTPSAGTIVYSVSNAKALQPDARAVYIPKEQHAQETGKAIIGVAAVAFVIYEALKWGAAVAAAVPTGGTSIGIAAAMP